MIKQNNKTKLGSGGFERSGGDDQQFLFIYVASATVLWAYSPPESLHLLAVMKFENVTIPLK